MSRPVVVVGDVMADLVTRLDRPIAPGGDTPAHTRLHGGGAGANVAAWLAERGAPVVLAGCVGDDALGRDAAATLRACGVDARLAVAPGAPTGTCIVFVDAAGERTMLPDAGANDLLRPHDLPADAFRPGAHLHLPAYALMRDGSRAAARSALARARAAGMSTSVDASSAPLIRSATTPLRALLVGVGTLIVTEDEVRALTGRSDLADALAELRREYAELVLKRGAAGAAWWGPDGGKATCPAVPPPGPLRDTAGAGDAFAAAWLAARGDGASADDALAAACALGARVVSREGARPDGPGPPPGMMAGRHPGTRAGERPMEITRARAETKMGPADWFTGPVWFDEIATPPAPSRVRMVSVHFPPGSRTAWHSHPNGQNLHVTQGVGLAQRRGGPLEVIRAGDSVHFSPGEEHWHGAGPSSFMSHLALHEADAEGVSTVWGAHVSAEEYPAA